MSLGPALSFAYGVRQGLQFPFETLDHVAGRRLLVEKFLQSVLVGPQLRKLSLELFDPCLHTPAGPPIRSQSFSQRPFRLRREPTRVELGDQLRPHRPPVVGRHVSISLRRIITRRTSPRWWDPTGRDRRRGHARVGSIVSSRHRGVLRCCWCLVWTPGPRNTTRSECREVGSIHALHVEGIGGREEGFTDRSVVRVERHHRGLPRGDGRRTRRRWEGYRFPRSGSPS